MKYSRWQLAAKYLRYYFTASNGKGHGTHSPFIFQFITKVLNDRKVYPAYEKVETLRSELLKNEKQITLEDHGAGSAITKKDERKIADIARHSAKPRKLAQLIFRIVNYFQPSTIIELGTSLGITTSYLALAKPTSTIISIEGAAAVADQARTNFDRLAIDNIQLLKGNFDQLLPGIVSESKQVDFCFIDGNHQLEPTIRYFNLLMTRINNNSVLIFDDIHWSSEMEEAWDHIKKDQRVRCTVDLFFIGIVFFREEFKEKQDFSIRY